jgi:hypothetical protein
MESTINHAAFIIVAPVHIGELSECALHSTFEVSAAGEGRKTRFPRPF